MCTYILIFEHHSKLVKQVLTWFIHFQRWEIRGAEAKSLGHTHSKWQSESHSQACKFQTTILFFHDTVPLMEPTLWICLITAASLNSCILLCAQREKVASAAVRWPSGIQFPNSTDDLLHDTPDRDLGSSPEEQLKIQSIKILGTHRDCRKKNFSSHWTKHEENVDGPQSTNTLGKESSNTVSSYFHLFHDYFF